MSDEKCYGGRALKEMTVDMSISLPVTASNGAQLVGHRTAEIAKRIDILATAIFNELTIDQRSDLDLAYTPPLGSPWDALQTGAQTWARSVSLSAVQ